MTIKVESIYKDENEVVSKKFDGFSKRFVKKDDEGLSKSANHQIKQIIREKEKIHNVIDVGSGAGGLLVELINQGIESGTGIELSPKLIEASTERAFKCCENKITFIQGNFIESEINHHDAVSMHRVLCCFSDREEMLSKAISLNPEIITFTLLRERISIKFVRSLMLLIGKIKSSTFVFHVHNLKELHKQMIKEGYSFADETKTGFVWITQTYKRGK